MNVIHVATSSAGLFNVVALTCVIPDFARLTSPKIPFIVGKVKLMSSATSVNL